MDAASIESNQEREAFPWTLSYYVGFFIIIGLCLRWWGLELRPLHHDESIHVMFGRYFFDFPNDNFYKYNPEYHGPLLYNALRFVYDTFGDFEWSARALMCVMGSIMLFLPWALRRFFSPGIVIALTAALSLSPTMIYWSKFVREDMFVIFGMSMMVYGVFLARPSTKSLWVLLGIVFQYASKENSYVTMALFWGYFVIEYLARLFLTKRRELVPCSLFAPLPFAFVILFHLGMKMEGTAYHVVNFEFMHLGALMGAALVAADVMRSGWSQDRDQSLICRLFGHIATYRLPFIAAFVIAAFFFYYLFSAGFRYPEGVIDGLYRKGITYWMEKHAIERIKGPFLFHFYQLSWYEFGFMLMVFTQGIYFYSRQSLAVRLSVLGVAALALLAGFFNMPSDQFKNPEPEFFLWKKMKLKDWIDVVGAILLLAHPIFVTGTHFFKRQWDLAFWGYLFTATFLTYCYLGEKVPWLSSYPLLAGLAYLAVYFNHEYRIGNIRNLWIRSSDIAKAVGFLLLGAALWFILEEYLRWSTLNPGAAPPNMQKVLQSNRIYLALGLLILAWSFTEPYTKISKTLHLGKFLLIAYTVFTIRIAYMANFEVRYREFGYISQVHTTQELQTVARRIRGEILSKVGGAPKSVLVEGDSVWPLTWYFRDLPSYKFSATDAERPSFNYIFQDVEKPVPEGFHTERINLRGWWVPDFRTMTLKRFLAIALNLRPWGEPGYSYVNLLTKRS